MSQSIASLVETIPLGMEALRLEPADPETGTVLKRLVDHSVQQIDLVAMYWSLLPDDRSEDMEGLSRERLAELGAERGRLLYEALTNAAQRGVKIRILQSPGFKPRPHESDTLAKKFPDLVQVRQLDMRLWFAGGIMHQKMWVFDQQHIYIGSANMDWRSLSQVKELGVVVEHHSPIAADATLQFEAMWQLCELEPVTVRVLDPEVQIMRPVPAWSALVPAEIRIAPPWQHLNMQTSFNLLRPLQARINSEDGEVFITGSPPEFCTGDRTIDLDAILSTIDVAEKSVCVSVMDFAPTGVLGDECDEASGKWMLEGVEAPVIWWPTLIDALLRAAVARGVHVRLLVSHWAYTAPTTSPYLQALQATADAYCPDPAGGKLEIRRFVVPGWDAVMGNDREYPGHSRVNHTKYIVTDNQLNIGTSNLTWSYFAVSAGTSFNSTHPTLVNALQRIFDRDWESPYARLPDEIY